MVNWLYDNFIMDKIYDIITAIFIKLDHVNPVKTGKITDDLFVIRAGTANFFIYKYEEGLLCFDSGFGKNQISRELNKVSVNPDIVSHLFLTHSDFDHAMGVSVFKKAKLYLSSEEKQMITGKKARRLGFIYNFRIDKEYELLHDNDVITIGTTKVRAISTPGHTPGSMCYLINESILISGDSFRLVDGKIYPIKYYNMDTEEQIKSIKKLAVLENVQIVCTAHRGYSKDFQKAIHNWK